MRIIPAIDIIDGKCVRLTRGVYSTKIIYSTDPLNVAKAFEGIGITHLHVVDLDGAKSQHIVNHNVLESICSQTNLKVDFGGGLKSDADLQKAFDCGVNQVTVGSIAVKEPKTFADWLLKYGPSKIILGADSNKRKIATVGWQETSDLDVILFIQQHEAQGVSYVICTDIAKDGMLAGPSLALNKEIIDNTDVKLIASGGVSSIKDLYDLKALGCEGAIVGKAIYEGRITMQQLKKIC